MFWYSSHQNIKKYKFFATAVNLFFFVKSRVKKSTQGNKPFFDTDLFYSLFSNILYFCCCSKITVFLWAFRSNLVFKETLQFPSRQTCFFKSPCIHFMCRRKLLLSANVFMQISHWWWVSSVWIFLCSFKW